MRIQFFGAARTTTGSMHMLELDGKRVLLDCGMYQGRRKEAFERNRNLPFDAKAVDVCVLSHGHIDHSGNLPTLVKNGFRGPIIATPATRDLCEILLMDSAHIQEKDVEYVNKRRRKHGQNPFEPLYTQPDALKALEHFEPLDYDTPHQVVPGVQISFHDAGHILGAAFTTLDVQEDGRSYRLLYTGDMGRCDMPILRDPVVVHDVDYLITESTYGNREHPPREDVQAQLIELTDKVAERRSRLIIPSFSVGRTQNLLYMFNELWEGGKLKEFPIYVDSPLSSKATLIYDRHPECFDEEMRELIKNHDNPFSPKAVTYVTHVRDSKKLNNTRGPLVIISASGMCEGGRILHHLKCSVEDPNNIILIVGYQAQHTLGRRIVKKQSPIKIFGEQYDLNAEVHSIQALSAHADRNELIDYFEQMGPKVKRAFVVHGEPDQAEALAGSLRKLGAQNVVVPEMGQAEEI